MLLTLDTPPFDSFHILELYFSDIYADRRVPKNLMEDPVLWGECLTGALYWNDFLSIAKCALY